MTIHGRRAMAGALALALGPVVLMSGCGDPPPMVSMAPPGLGTEAISVDLSNDANRAVALGEEAAAVNRAARKGSTVRPQSVLREPTEPGEEVITERGLAYRTLQEGREDSVPARVGDSLVVHYTGRLEDGTVFDTTEGRGPFRFTLQEGPGGVIAGWVDGIPGMRIGEHRRLTIPPELGYGEQGAGGAIPPGATLIFEVELVEVDGQGG